MEIKITDVLRFFVFYMIGSFILSLISLGGNIFSYYEILVFTCVPGILWLMVFLALHLFNINRLIFKSIARSICYALLSIVTTLFIFFTFLNLIACHKGGEYTENAWYNNIIFHLILLFFIPIFVAVVDNFIYFARHKKNDVVTMFANERSSTSPLITNISV